MVCMMANQKLHQVVYRIANENQLVNEKWFVMQVDRLLDLKSSDGSPFFNEKDIEKLKEVEDDFKKNRLDLKVFERILGGIDALKAYLKSKPRDFKSLESLLNDRGFESFIVDQNENKRPITKSLEHDYLYLLSAPKHFREFGAAAGKLLGNYKKFQKALYSPENVVKAFNRSFPISKLESELQYYIDEIVKCKKLEAKMVEYLDQLQKTYEDSQLEDAKTKAAAYSDEEKGEIIRKAIKTIYIPAVLGAQNNDKEGGSFSINPTHHLIMIHDALQSLSDPYKSAFELRGKQHLWKDNNAALAALKQIVNETDKGPQKEVFNEDDEAFQKALAEHESKSGDERKVRLTELVKLVSDAITNEGRSKFTADLSDLLSFQGDIARALPTGVDYDELLSVDLNAGTLEIKDTDKFLQATKSLIEEPVSQSPATQEDVEPSGDASVDSLPSAVAKSLDEDLTESIKNFDYKNRDKFTEDITVNVPISKPVYDSIDDEISTILYNEFNIVTGSSAGSYYLICRRSQLDSLASRYNMAGLKGELVEFGDVPKDLTDSQVVTIEKDLDSSLREVLSSPEAVYAFLNGQPVMIDFKDSFKKLIYNMRPDIQEKVPVDLEQGSVTLSGLESFASERSSDLIKRLLSDLKRYEPSGDISESEFKDVAEDVDTTLDDEPKDVKAFENLMSGILDRLTSALNENERLRSDYLNNKPITVSGIKDRDYKYLNVPIYYGRLGTRGVWEFEHLSKDDNSLEFDGLALVDILEEFKGISGTLFSEHGHPVVESETAKAEAEEKERRKSNPSKPTQSDDEDGFDVVEEYDYAPLSDDEKAAAKKTWKLISRSILTAIDKVDGFQTDVLNANRPFKLNGMYSRDRDGVEALIKYFEPDKDRGVFKIKDGELFANKDALDILEYMVRKL